MALTKESIEAKLSAIRTERERLLAMVHAHEGAIQLATHLIAEFDKPPEEVKQDDVSTNNPS